ncbi:TBC1 domain family member 16-like [Porites lutea]|uniref:TBC1 domain family member 16-like n=1 Tax=Porites lutea TaxID=51062 RepID=UPI003CC5C2D1
MLSHLIKFAVEGAAVHDSSIASSFYVDLDDDPEESDELVFCKNNVCVHLSSLNDSHTPGYFRINSKTQQSGHVRLLITWTPNSFLCDSNTELSLEKSDDCECNSRLLTSSNPLETFRVDLSEMKTLRIFYNQEDPTCGQLVIGNFENHYKVFHFHRGGLDRVTDILDEWHWCSLVIDPLDHDELRRKTFTVVSKKNLKHGFHPEEGRFDPMSTQKWRTFFNDSGQIEDVANFRKATFFGGLSPEVRGEAWKFLLQYFPFSSTTRQRDVLRKTKEEEYMKIDHMRQNKSEEEQHKFWKAVQCTVDKDVVRTDRSHPYFSGDNNPNVAIMRNILLNYATYNYVVGYNQGMSDLLASVLAIVQDEVDAFWCFVSLMEGSVFVTSPKDDVMDRQLTYFRELLRMLEPDFYAHLLLQDAAMDMLFCHRWLLLSFKREFFNEEVLKMWEACWSRYQTDYFHIFLCVAMVQVYGKVIVEMDMQADDILQYFTDLSMKMDGTKVLRIARQLLLKFRQLPGIPCSLRGLLSGPGIWDSAPLPVIQCSCHNRCLYLFGDKSEQELEERELVSENEQQVSLEAEEKPEQLVRDNDNVEEVSVESQNQVHVCQKDDTSQLESGDQDNSNFGCNGSIIALREEDVNLTRGVAEGADSNADQNQFEEPAPEEEKEEISNP